MTLSQTIDLAVKIGSLKLANPIMVASGTFGYAQEMADAVTLSRLGAIIPKTITLRPRQGNPPPRTVETPAGMLNSIGLDNDGIDAFLEEKLPYLVSLGPPIIVSIAAKNRDEFVELAERLSAVNGVAALELNISCPNVSGGIDFATDPRLCYEVVTAVRDRTQLPIITKLTPNVTNIAQIARAAQDAGSDGVCAINTLLGLAVDWRRCKPRLGGGFGGLSGPAIKPVALRAVYQIAQAVSIPVVGVGGISNIDDCMEFLVAGASAIQIGTANFFNPKICETILDALPKAVAQLGAKSVREIVGRLQIPRAPNCQH